MPSRSQPSPPSARAIGAPPRDFALEVHFSRWEFAARYNLAASDAESLTLDELLALATPQERAAFGGLWLGYTPTWGDPRLRAAIAGTYDTIVADQVLTFAGAEEAIYVAMRVLLGADDHAIVVVPKYQAAETLPLGLGQATGVALDPSQGWSLDVDAVRAAIRPDTRLVSINFPNNPTGRILPRAQFDALVEVCRQHGVWLFSDEVYRLIEASPELRLPQVADVYERGISLNVMSKSYGLPGLRIGWLAAQDRAVLQRCERYKHYLSICNSAPSEQLAIVALAARDTILDRNRAIVAQNLDHLDRFFGRFADLFDWQRPDGSCVAFIRYRGADGVEAFTQALVEQAGVLLLPASVYRSDLAAVPTDHFRIGFGRRLVPQALGAMAAWLHARAG